MNAKNEAKLMMFRGVESLLDTNSELISTVAALVTAVAAFKTVIAGILETMRDTDVDLAGIRVDKENSRQALARMAADIAGFIRAFAAASGNNTLKTEVGYTFSDLMRVRSQQVVPRCRIIRDRGMENLDPLKNYGVTGPKLEELQQAIDRFAAQTPSTRTALGRRKTQNAKLGEFFKQADDILIDQIDNLMRHFRTSHPDFYQNYRVIREIPDASTTRTQLKGVISDAADNQPVKGALIEIVELRKTAKTDSKGRYTIKPIAHGRFTVKVTKEGYEPFEDDEFDIKLGEIKHLDVGLAR